MDDQKKWAVIGESRAMDASRQMVLLGPWTENRLNVVRMEPITAATIVVWLAQGAVAYVGGMALGAILGHPNLNNISNLIARAVEEIKQFVRIELQRQIQANEIMKLEAQIEASVRNLRQFDLAPNELKPQRRFLVEDAIIRAGEAMSLARRYDINGLFVYSCATSTRLIGQLTLQELEGSNDRAALTDTLVEGTKHVRAMLGKHETSWLPNTRLSAPWFTHCADCGPVGEPVVWIVHTKDGMEFTSRVPYGMNPQDATNAFWVPVHDSLRDEYQNAMNRTAAPLSLAVDSWEELIA